MNKTLWFIVAALLAFASADATSRKAGIEMIYQPIGENGDYRLSIYGGRTLTCEEHPVKIVGQPDALNPIVIECRHEGK